MRDLVEAFRVRPGTRVRLSRRDPAFTAGLERKRAEKILREDLARLYDLQYLLYAENRRSLLVVLQAMDAAGKSGAIRHVISGLHPLGVKVTAFKKPSAEELDHDFLWRIHKEVPGKGEVGVFDRSHYEDAISRCSTDRAPWFVIPADKKWFRNLAVARILAQTLEELGMQWPGPEFDHDELERSL